MVAQCQHKGHEFKVILGYLESSRPAYKRPCLKKKSKQTKSHLWKEKCPGYIT